MLNENHPQVPGYVPHLARPIGVSNLDHDPEIRKREASFSFLFHIDKARRKAKFSRFLDDPRHLYDRQHRFSNADRLFGLRHMALCGSECFGEEGMAQLQQKVNLIKDWLDANIRMPVYFFLCDVEDVRNGHFGDVSSESSGSTQKNILKEEFYRTAVLIAGKIPSGAGLRFGW
jgi:adenylate cyclase class 1